ncbi:glyoxylate/hydroxypyruvate reductase A [Palleronia sediminis]|uniref:Glyoxylate/hydroxypyruvate reductase A n=1 Tax=Palleronia sediminis TaxID=2547833 RepID=A0A4R6A4G8_9RHOB|nr:glyoxylate/hydroxypyruvate reductase A [Palleronia sediminis]TDL75996.1 glyoxylate/hydroxypyruvate reductase A [Palleronia sediminis]
MIHALFAAPQAYDAAWTGPLTRAFAAAGLDVALSRDHAPETVDYIILAPSGPVTDFSPFIRAKAVLNLWAGVETVVDNPTLTQPLARMVDPGLTAGMVEYVAGHVLRHHLGIDAHLAAAPGAWDSTAPPLAQDRPVAMLGLGALGTACAKALVHLGFPVSGWSNSPKSIPGVTSATGRDGLDRTLAGADIVVTLLPLTPDTECLLDAGRLAAMRPGAVLVNPGRGGLVDDAALIAALDRGHLGHATLDAFRTEPLPEDHPFWHHPRVTVTPHIASATRPETAAGVIAENIRRGEAGAPLLHLVDRDRGY